jgi:hypothetical protein
MTRTILILTIFLFSCGQASTGEKTQSNETKASVDSTTDTFVTSKKSLDSLFLLKKDSTKFSFQDLRTTLFIGNLFDKNSRYAVIRYKDNDTVTKVLVLKQSKNMWDTIFSTKIFPVSTSALEDLLQIADYNGDNIPDLKVVKDFWDIHPGDNSDLWLYSKEGFTKVLGFDSIVSAEYDKTTDRIYSYMSTGCADMSMYFGTFKIIDGKLKKIQEMNCDCCDDEHKDSCKIEIVGKKPFSVPYNTAYKHVPKYFADGVKEKCEMTK